jgi:hypothetical protein
MSQLPSIRLRPTESALLTTQAFDSGSVYYDSNKNTLVIMDGRSRGGYELLRADLSNIAGGGAGSGNVNFGARSITAQAFIGDGSQLTNLPTPAGVATLTDISTAITTAFTTVHASTTQFGTVKVDGTSITIDPVTGVISSSGGGGGGGVDLTAFSVGTPNAASGSGAISYDNTTGVFKYTPPDLTGYLTTYTETSTLDTVVGRGATTDKAVTINNTVTATTFSGTTGNITTVNSTTLTATTINTNNIINSGTGVPRWTSGSDFIIDAAGDVNVVGSKITNLATPTKSTDAATKAYVDGAASAFSGGTVTGAINITNATASTSTTTGALKVAGGVGIVGDVYAGGLIYSGGSPVLTSDSGGWNGGIVGGTVYINNTLDSTSTTTGALRVRGGAGIQGTLNVGADATFNSIRFGRGAGASSGYTTNVAISGALSAGDYALASNSTGTNDIAIGQKALSAITNATDNVAIGVGAQSLKTAGNHNVTIGTNTNTSGVASYNTIVGSLALSSGTGDTTTAIGYNSLTGSAGTSNIALGAGAGSALVAGDYNVIIGSNTGSTITGTSNNIIISDGAGNIRIRATSTGDVKILSTTASTDATSGSLQVGGGLGVSGAINATGIVKLTSGTASTSTTSGTLQVTGGVGVSGAVWATSFNGDGSGLTGIAASSYSGGTVTGATSFTYAGANSASTSTTTGAVKITSGLGVQGAIYAANYSGATIPSAGSVPGANGLVRTDGSGYAYTNYINSNTANSEAIDPLQIIATNSSDNFYRKVNFSRMNSGARAQANITGGGTITFNASGYLLWGTRFIVISAGYGAAFSTGGYFDITCPTSGTITGVGGHANVTATAAGIPLAVWDALYYILPVGSTTTSLAANFRVASYTAALDVPYNWVLLGVYNGDSSTLFMTSGIRLKAGQSIDTSATINPALNSLGVGTTASGTAGEIRATNEVTAYYSSDRTLKENIVPIENALGKLRQITGVMFDWTDEEIAKRGGEDGYFVRKHDTGVIAQDVEPQLPEVVATRADGTKAVKYEKLAGLIIQAINELADQVDELKKKVG